jgi:hypothetical protein
MTLTIIPPQSILNGHNTILTFTYHNTGTMLQVLNHDVSKQSRAIDDSQRRRAFGGVEFSKAKGDTDIIGSVLRQEKESKKARDARERRVYYNRTNNKSKPEAKAVEELLRTYSVILLFFLLFSLVCDLSVSFSLIHLLPPACIL